MKRRLDSVKFKKIIYCIIVYPPILYSFIKAFGVMQLLSSCRGALNGLMGDLIEGHIREHIVQAENKKDAAASGEDLIDMMKSFWK